MQPAQQFILGIYPKAFCISQTYSHFDKPVYWIQIAPYWVNSYTTTLGFGYSEAAAWKSAKEELEEEAIRKFSE